MMAQYINAEYHERVMCVGAADGNLSAAHRLYDECFVSGRPMNPRSLPSIACFRGLVNRLHETSQTHFIHPDEKMGQRQGLAK
jgi:hypothetical protein